MKQVSKVVGPTIAALFMGAAIGCSSAAAHAPPTSSSMSEAGTGGDLYETVSSTAFQLDTVVQALTEALDDIQGKIDASSGREKEVYSALRDLVDHAGETLGDFPVPPKGKDEVQKNEAHFGRWEVSAKTAAQAALKSVLQAESLQASFDPDGRQARLTEKLRTAEDGLRGAIDKLSNGPQ